MAVDSSVNNVKDIQSLTTTSIVADIQSLQPSALIDLFVLDMSSATGVANDLLYFHAGTNAIGGNIVWQGKTYIRLPIEAEGFASGSSGSLPRPKIRLANIDGAFSNTLANYGDLIGCKITRKRTFAKYLDSINFPKKNLLTYTEQLDVALWTKTASYIIKDAIEAPDGSLTGDKFCELSTTATAHYMDFVNFPSRSITLNNLNTYTRSFYIKGGERTRVYLYAFSQPITSTNVRVFFDTVTGLFFGDGVTGSATNHTFKATAEGNGWWRVSQTYDFNTADVDMYLRVLLVTGTATTSYISTTGNGVYIWGNQLELGELTPYVPSLPIFVSRASTATYVGSDGFIKLAAINAPRYSYNPANLSAPPKLLIEASSTNYAYGSVSATLTVGTGTATAPDGTLAKQVITNSLATQSFSSVSRSIVQPFTLAVAGVRDMVFSGYFSQKTSNTLNVGADIIFDFYTLTGSANHTYYECKVDVSTMTLSSSIGADIFELYKKIELAPCGMYKVTCAARYTQGVTIRDSVAYGIQVRSAGGTVGAFTGDGTSGFQYSHLQVENGSAPSSYIPTTTAYVARSADVSTAELGVNPSENPNQYYPDDIWFIDQKVSETRYLIEWELASAFDLIGVMLPSRQVNQNSCSWKYGGTECGYNPNAVGAKLFNSADEVVSTVATDVCGKRLTSCEARFGKAKTIVLPYGGFPGAMQYG